MGNTVPSLFAAIVGRDPSLPLVTFYDDESGERAELSGATLANWVAKTANLLVDGCGLGPGDQATVWLPPHWQSAAVLLGAWSAGLTVAYGEPTAAGADVEFASLAVVEAGPPAGPADRFVLGLAPMGMPLREVPPGWADFVADMRRHGDHFPGAPVGDDTVALLDPDGTAVTHAALVERAVARAAGLGITGGRVLVDADVYPWPVDWLLAPLAAGASVVLSTHTDLAKLPARAESEQAVQIVGPTV
ncbi:TIGR03089 family protein [Dactylosporangium sp. AC04546]|uniref:TIGR03089 family protein n=1 Tax=Dactylosporangium sp. AC04546 TaxID=2862460 RepID=UPI001EDD8757|nr:TIGR03089 family protein [Dactylosporangium sp. AC04546]WVK83004.1 TIGR03089 family protein [Dactylosporangium sp. AC04546]